ncbi:dynein assembly factor 3, axonemal [Caerostris darwini]|uniref:Dynein assembly factor 3, axonemal n=1 Tax=Caerostris darwini TaxID=1538125 RepID=A0AAV4VKB3_9ARAC|nr:dynein assembly factor 3, axonemal [Caerostris darwini]
MTYRHLMNFWPLVPALDLQNIVSMCNSCATEDSNIKKYSDETFQVYKQKNTGSQMDVLQQDESTETNYLLVGNSIGCLFKTLARLDRHPTAKLNLYVAFTFPESLSRCLLLLSLFSNSFTEASLLEKAEMFLEILGNTYIRASTASYIENASMDILKNLDRPELNSGTLLRISTMHMKQKEIDELVKIFMYLKNKEMSYDIGKAWENALRSFFGQRFDSRKNLFDYHFNMKLEDYSIINLRKYIDWCETGTAFKFRSAKYNYPNKTMAVQRRNNRLKQTQGILNCYVGDIATSPYLVFGVESGNDELFKKVNNEYTSTSEDISKYNVIEMLDEFTTFNMKSNSKDVVLNLMFFDTLCKSRKFDKSFDAIYIPCDMMHCSNKILPKLLKVGGIAVFETIRNVVNSTKEQKEKHSEEIFRLSHSGGLTNVECPEFNSSDNYKVFKLVAK